MSDDPTAMQQGSTEELEPLTIRPRTRRTIIWTLFLICVACIAAEVALAMLAGDKSDALMAVASACVGGIAGMAVPPGPRGD